MECFVVGLLYLSLHWEFCLAIGSGYNRIYIPHCFLESRVIPIDTPGSLPIPVHGIYLRSLPTTNFHFLSHSLYLFSLCNYPYPLPTKYHHFLSSS